MEAAQRDRVAAGALTAITVAGLGYVLLLGLTVRQGAAAPDSAIHAFALPPVPELAPPPPRTPVRPRPQKHPAGAAAPPDLKRKLSEVVVPPPVVVPPAPPPPVVVAPAPGTGTAAHAGTAERAGPGTGAGGHGTGHGAGGEGNGSGGGGDGDGGTPPREIYDYLGISALPRDLAETSRGGTVETRYYVLVDGHVAGCQVTRSSGDPALDAETCRLIEKRFRYRPALDEDGQPVRSIIVNRHEWIFDRRDAEDDDGR